MGMLLWGFVKPLMQPNDNDFKNVDDWRDLVS